MQFLKNRLFLCVARVTAAWEVITLLYRIMSTLSQGTYTKIFGKESTPIRNIISGLIAR